MVHVLDTSSPIDGSPAELRSHSGYYNSVTNSVRRTIDSLQQVTNGIQTQSEAVAAFAEIASEVQSDLKLVEIRYETFVEQLSVYATELQRLQEEATAIRSVAHSAEDDYNTYTWRASDVAQEAQYLDYQDPAWAEKQRLIQSLRAQADDAEAVIARKQRDLENLMDEWREIADRCADQIAAALEASELNDGWWETFTHWVEHTLPSIEMWLDILAVVLTVLAILAVLTGVGAALAPALFMIARGIQMLSKAIKVMKILTTVTQVARGEKPPSALVALAVDAAIDKVAGKLIDGLGDKAMGGLIDKYGVALVEYAKEHGNATLELNAKELVNNGFSGWAESMFADAVMPGVGDGGFGDRINNGIGNVGSFFDATDGFLGSFAEGTQGMMADAFFGPGASGILNAPSLLGGFNGPDYLLSGLAGDSLGLLNNVDSPFYDRGLAQLPTPSFESVMPGPPPPYRPSLDDLVSAS
ncbi:MAG: hypothetical protein CVT64_03150 [Actinobacteria bacterium HGW-Actinobacteria-4]|nr:MAG: hypothetical protein CVT64_03150 [Actinobacteria bacterium HGW-Actinobacteria-4]